MKLMTPLAVGLLMTTTSAWVVAAEDGPRISPSHTLHYNFDSPQSANRWRAIHGHWAVQDGAYSQTDTHGPAYRYTVRELPFVPDLISFDATPIEKNDYGFASFGVLIGYTDKANWTAVRFGSYGCTSTVEAQKGRKTYCTIGRFVPELGKTYQLTVVWKDDRIGVFLDGILRYVLRRPLSRRRASIGFFTESRCRFDNFTAFAGSRGWQRFKTRVLSSATRRRAALRTSRSAETVITKGTFEDRFERSDLGTWRAAKDSWRIRKSRLEMSATRWGRYLALAPVSILDGVIEGTATPTGKGKFGRGVFGVVVKWIDAANWAAIRYGQYGGVAAYVLRNGKQHVKGICRFEAKVGRTYRFKVDVKDERVVAYCDGKRLGEVTIDFAGRTGRPGLYTEAPVAFNDFRVRNARPLEKKAIGPLAGNPALKSEFATFRPPPPIHGIRAIAGGLYLYVRNTGDGAAVLRRVLIDGLDADAMPHIVVWHRQRPFKLKPGDVGEISIRFDSLPADVGLALFESPSGQAKLPVTVEPYRAAPLHVLASVATTFDPIQVNYIAFGPARRRVFIYVQRNDTISKVWHIRRVWLNGRNVTARARFGQRVISDTVVPIVVDLPTALRWGEPAVVCVETQEGDWAGHCLRAFPGKFQIQVTLCSKQVRPDAVEDIWRHGATCIGLCGASTERLVEAKALGLDAFHYGGGLATLRRFDKPKFPPISGCWLDEMDDYPVRRTFDMIQECEEAYRQEGKYIPPQMINLCKPRTPGALTYYELGDAVCSAYGFHGGALGEQFGRRVGLPQREYRMTRRTFLPYFRNAEMPVVVDPRTKKVLGREPKHRRCIEPKEERWMTYGCLIQGAKGIMHWNYGAGLGRPPNWFSKTQWVIRASLGGALGGKPHGYELPRDMAEELRRTWGEIGRINVELRAIGPLVAVSDVSNLARVVDVKPAQSPTGEPAAEAAALISGLDSIVLIVLNHNIKTNWTSSAQHGIDSYEPVDATVGLRLPPWLEPKCMFRVRYNRVERLTPTRKADRLTFRFPNLDVSEIVVVTSCDDLFRATAHMVTTLRSRLLD